MFGKNDPAQDSKRQGALGSLRVWLLNEMTIVQFRLSIQGRLPVTGKAMLERLGSGLDHFALSDNSAVAVLETFISHSTMNLTERLRLRSCASRHLIPVGGSSWKRKRRPNFTTRASSPSISG